MSLRLLAIALIASAFAAGCNTGSTPKKEESMDSWLKANSPEKPTDSKQPDETEGKGAPVKKGH